MIRRIKIVSCEGLQSWYRDHIGDEFNVIRGTEHSPDDWDLVDEHGKREGYYVRNSDCMFVDDIDDAYNRAMSII